MTAEQKFLKALAQITVNPSIENEEAFVEASKEYLDQFRDSSKKVDECDEIEPTWKPEIGSLYRNTKTLEIKELKTWVSGEPHFEEYRYDFTDNTWAGEIVFAADFTPIAELDGLEVGRCIYFYNNSAMHVWMIRHDVFLFGDEEVYCITDSCNDLVVSMQGKVYGLPIKFYRTADRAERLGGI